ncbi:histidine--tRNA ligase [Patescibacteria group bacterium]|nr:histidine--tRNA ligase [Patescibacteria group bacterium]MBU1015498.1 histidine--tRNA ligase [Patescibacteria group bacterium]MBU1685421.1 histidine--tRNA ligase [Patescibacteria group bacterium]MBU1938382.1 histidine--tRNA ligase [Patescibacteria group bacterium]
MSNPRYQSPKGVHDILPDDHLYFSFIKKVVRHHCRRAGFRRISTPIFEDVEVFKRSIGESSDIVEKEMFLFESKSGKKYALKPEGTAGVVRAYLEHGLSNLPKPVEFYYIEPHFRYNRPQKGRYRQFHQFGFEVLGESDPAIDAQVIYISHRINYDLGIADRLTLQLNTIGSSEDRKQYREDLVNYYTGKERSLCEDCKRRMYENPMRLLDCKEEDCQILASMAPKLESVLSEESKEHFSLLQEYLTELGVKYELNPTLVRGLDYYTHTVFEFWSKKEGSQNATGGGGRYDGLVELMGGESTPAIGYAAGMERIVEYMKEAGIRPPNKDKVEVFVAQLGLVAKKKSLSLINELRNLGINTVGAIGKSSMKGQMGLADKLNAKYSLILGQIEVQEGTIILRNMEKGSQEIVPYEGIVEKMKTLLGEKKLSSKKLWEE